MNFNEFLYRIYGAVPEEGWWCVCQKGHSIGTVNGLPTAIGVRKFYGPLRIKDVKQAVKSRSASFTTIPGGIIVEAPDDFDASTLSFGHVVFVAPTREEVEEWLKNAPEDIPCEKCKGKGGWLKQDAWMNCSKCFGLGRK